MYNLITFSIAISENIYYISGFLVRPRFFNLSYDGGFTDLSFNGGGGAQSAPPIFIYKNKKKSNKNMHCVEKKII